MAQNYLILFVKLVSEYMACGILIFKCLHNEKFNNSNQQRSKKLIDFQYHSISSMLNVHCYIYTP